MVRSTNALEQVWEFMEGANRIIAYPPNYEETLHEICKKGADGWDRVTYEWNKEYCPEALKDRRVFKTKPEPIGNIFERTKELLDSGYRLEFQKAGDTIETVAYVHKNHCSDGYVICGSAIEVKEWPPL